MYFIISRQRISAITKFCARPVNFVVAGFNCKHRQVCWAVAWDWEAFPTVYEWIKWSSKPNTYLGVPLDQYKNNDDLWTEKTKGLSVLTQKLGSRDLSIFARATICNVFLVSRLVYLLQALSRSRINIQRIQRLLAVFVWQSQYERTSRNNLFLRLKRGGVALPHLFLRQVVSRFLFLRDQQDPFLRTFLEIRLASALPNFIVTSNDEFRYGVRTFLREVVVAFRFVRSRFSLEYLSNLTRKCLSRDLNETVLFLCIVLCIVEAKEKTF